MYNPHNQLINSCFWMVLQYGNFQSVTSKQTLNRLWMIQEYDYLPTSLSRPRRTQKLLHLCVRAKFSKTILARFPAAKNLWNRILIDIRLKDAEKLQDHHGDLFHNRKYIFSSDRDFEKFCTAIVKAPMKKLVGLQSLCKQWV